MVFGKDKSALRTVCAALGSTRLWAALPLCVLPSLQLGGGYLFNQKLAYLSF